MDPCESECVVKHIWRYGTMYVVIYIQPVIR